MGNKEKYTILPRAWGIPDAMVILVLAAIPFLISLCVLPCWRIIHARRAGPKERAPAKEKSAKPAKGKQLAKKGKDIELGDSDDDDDSDDSEDDTKRKKAVDPPKRKPPKADDKKKKK